MQAIWVVAMHSRTEKHIAQSRTAPFAVHDGCIAPINALDFLEQGPHGMAAVTGAFQRTDNFMLGKFRGELVDRQC